MPLPFTSNHKLQEPVFATWKWQELVLAAPITSYFSLCRHALKMARTGSCLSHNFLFQPVLTHYANGKNQFLPQCSKICGKNRFLPLHNGKNLFLPLPITSYFSLCRHALKVARTSSCHSPYLPISACVDT